MARLILIFVVALVNLALGFAIAVKAGRGPWSRHARRLATSAVPPEAAVPGLAAPEMGPPGKSIEQIANELEALESRVLSVQEQMIAAPNDSQSLEALQSILRDGLTQIAALVANETSTEYPEQATAGLCALLVVFQTVANDLEEAGAAGRAGSTDANTLATRLLMSCREAGVVFNGLRFAELPT